MKSIFKLLPVALGLLTLASCSNDEIFNTEKQTSGIQLADDEILVYVESEPATRAAFGEAVQQTGDQYALKRAVFWREGDIIKVYDDMNWRPKYFEFKNADATVLEQAKNAAGELPAVFKLNTTLTPTLSSSDDQLVYDKGYAVFPGKKTTAFEGEERGTINFDLNDLRFWQWDAEKVKYFSETTEDGTSWHTVFPMWGNIGYGSNPSKALALKYLTGFLRIEKNQLTTGKYGYLVIEATKQLWGDYKATNFDYLAKAAPVLVGQAETSAVYAALPTSERTIKFNQDNSSDNDQNASTLIIELPAAKMTSASNTFYIPVPASTEGYGIQVYYKEYDAAQKEITISASDEAIFKDAAFKEITANGKFYNIDRIVEADVKTPKELRDLIVKYDQKGRDVTVDIKHGTNPFTITGDDSDQDYLIDLSEHALQHNITLNFTESPKVEDKTHTAKLFIKTAASSKVLTLNFEQDMTAPIVINHNRTDYAAKDTETEGQNVLGPVVIGGVATISKIETYNVAQDAAGNDLVTIKAKVTEIYADGNVTIDLLRETNANMTVGTLKHNKKGTITLKNGIISKYQTNGANINSTQKAVVNSFGKSAITDYKNWADDATGSFNIVDFTSTWDGKVYKTDSETLYGEAITAQQKIFTASQLAVIDNSSAYNLRTDVIIDEEETEGTWPAIALTKNFIGYNHNVKLNLVKANATTTGTGLFASIEGVSNLSNLNIEANISIPTEATFADRKSNIGALAGFAKGTNVIFGIKVNAAEESASNVIGYETAGNGVGGNIGGVIGAVQGGKTTIHTSTVAGLISGYENLGGFVGSIGTSDHSDAAEVVIGTETATSDETKCASTATFAEKKTFALAGDNADEAGTIGAFVGKVYADDSNAGKLTVGRATTAAVTSFSALAETGLKFNRNIQKLGTDAATGLKKLWYYQGSTDFVVGYSDAKATVIKQYLITATGTIADHTYVDVTPTEAGVNNYDVATKPYFFNHYEMSAAE